MMFLHSIIAYLTECYCDQGYTSGTESTDTHASKVTFGTYPLKMLWREITRGYDDVHLQQLRLVTKAAT